MDTDLFKMVLLNFLIRVNQCYQCKSVVRFAFLVAGSFARFAAKILGSDFPPFDNINAALRDASDPRKG
jgi:hypothetical protein